MKRGLKYTAMTLVMMMFMTMSSNIFASSGPDISIEHIITLDEMIAGSDVNIRLDLKNGGTSDAKDLSVSLDTMTPGISLIGTTMRSVEEIDPNSIESVNFALNLDVQLEAGYYPLTLTGQYEDSQGMVIPYRETFYVDILSEDTRDRIKLHISDTAIETGENATLNVQVTNTYMDTLTNIDIKPLNSEAVTFLSAYITEGLRLNTAEETMISQPVFVSDMTVTGFYPVQLEISYLDHGVPYKELEMIYIRVNNDGVNSNSETLSFISVTHSKNSIGVEEAFETLVTIKNLSDEPIQDIALSIQHDTGLIMMSQNKFLIERLEPGESVTNVFRLQSTKDTPTGNMPMEYSASFQQGMQIEQYFSGIYVTNDEAGNASTTPRILIDQYTLSQDTLFVGDTFDMTLNLINTSDEKNVENLKMTINIMDEMGISTSILPVGQSQSIYVGDIAMGDIIPVTIPFEILSTADGKIYTYQFNYEFEDDKGMMYSDQENIHVPVYQIADLTLSDVRFGKILDNGYTLEMDFYNTGKSVIRNLMMDIEGEFTALNSNYFVGDFATGRMDVYDVQMQGDAPNFVEGTIIYTYDDTFGNTISKEMLFKVENVLFEVSDSIEVEPEAVPNQPMIWPYIIALLVVLFVVVLVIRRKKSGDA